MTLADTPWPVDSGKRIRQWTNLRALAQIADVDAVVAFADGPAVGVPPGVALRRFLVVPPGERPPGRGFIALMGGRPWHVAVRRWDHVRAALGELGSSPYDLVWFGGVDHALELDRAVRARRIVIDMDDLETHKVRAFLDLPADPGLAGRLKRTQRRIELPMWRRLEKRSLDRADRVLVCSDEDRLALSSPVAAVLPNAFPDPGERPTPRAASSDLLLVGNFDYLPNEDSAHYMATEVMPLLRASVPNATLRLVGRGGGSSIARLAELPGVVHVGAVHDTLPELLGAGAAVVPVRWGGGTRIKILEAFASRVPVISTSLGCAGYPVEDRVHLLVRDDAAEFAQACAEVLADVELADRLANAGERLYRDHYTPDAVGEQVRRIVAELLR